MAEQRSQVPLEAVDRACAAYVEARFDLHHDIKPTDSEKVGMRAALEASGAVFLTDDEREALCYCIDRLGVEALEPAREKLA